MHSPTNSALRPTPDEFLAAFPPQIQATAQRLRRLIMELAPNVTEAVYVGWHLLGYRLMDRKQGRYFCYIAPMHDQVRLGFEYGVLLTDKQGILQGAGKQVRYVSLRHDQELPIETLTGLIAEAAAVAILPRHR